MEKKPLIRKQFNLTEAQCENLRKDAQKRNLPEAEILRRIIDDYYEKKEGEKEK